MNLTKYLVEFLGSAFFIFVVLATGNPLAIGVAFILAMLLTANISGGNINPVISIVLASAGKLETNELVPYCVAQIVGGLTALEIYKRIQV
jgi:aquaporin Z